MARPNIADIRPTVDFQKTYTWELVMIHAPTGGYFTMGANNPSMNMLCTSTEVPRYEGETARQMMKGYQILDPGIYNAVGRLTLTFVETTSATIRASFDNWMAACRDKPVVFSGLYADFVLRSLGTQDQITYEYNLKWCFPDATEPQEYDSENSNPMTYRVTLRYNDVRVATQWVPQDDLGNVGA